MATYYGTNFDTLQAAKIAQQDADTRAAAQQLNFLLTLAGQRNQRAIAERGAQSEDYRTGSGERLGMRRSDVEEGLGTDRNQNERLRLLNEAMTGNNANVIAQGNLDRLKALDLLQNEDAGRNRENALAIARMQLDAAAKNAAAAGAEKQRELQIQYGDRVGNLQLLQDQIKRQQLQAQQDQINSQIDQAHHWSLTSGIPLLGGPSDASRLAAINSLLKQQGLDKEYTVTVDPTTGTPKAWNKTLLGLPVEVGPPAPSNPPPSNPVAPNIPTTTAPSPAAARVGLLNSFLRMTGQGGTTPSLSTAPLPPIQTNVATSASISPRPRINPLGQVAMRDLQTGQLVWAPNMTTAILNQQDGTHQIVFDQP